MMKGILAHQQSATGERMELSSKGGLMGEQQGGKLKAAESATDLQMMQSLEQIRQPGARSAADLSDVELEALVGMGREPGRARQGGRG